MNVCDQRTNEWLTNDIGNDIEQPFWFGSVVNTSDTARKRLRQLPDGG